MNGRSRMRVMWVVVMAAVGCTQGAEGNTSGSDILSPPPPIIDVRGGYKGEFIDLGENDRLYIRYCLRADDGVWLERIADGKFAWRVHCKRLGVQHTKYNHRALVKIRDGVIYVESRGSAGGFKETRKVETGELIERLKGKSIYEEPGWPW